METIRNEGGFSEEYIEALLKSGVSKEEIEFQSTLKSLVNDLNSDRINNQRAIGINVM